MDKMKIAEGKSIIDFGFHAGADNPDHIGELASLNPASFKIFMDLLDDDDLMSIFSDHIGFTRN